MCVYLRNILIKTIYAKTYEYIGMNVLLNTVILHRGSFFYSVM